MPPRVTSPTFAGTGLSVDHGVPQCGRMHRPGLRVLLCVLAGWATAPIVRPTHLDVAEIKRLLEPI